MLEARSGTVLGLIRLEFTKLNIVQPGSITATYLDHCVTYRNETSWKGVHAQSAGVVMSSSNLLKNVFLRVGLLHCPVQLDWRGHIQCFVVVLVFFFNPNFQNISKCSLCYKTISQINHTFRSAPPATFLL